MNRERMYQILLGPHVSEKSTMAAETSNQIVFQVATTATKVEVKQAVEALFDVQVKQVSVVNVKGKTKRTRNGLGRRSDWRKAYVRLAEGQDIDFASMD